jgi:[protein-PII] uridylyltransferase
VTGPGDSSSAAASALQGARAELRADIKRGTGGRTSLERYSDRIDALLRRLVSEAPRPARPVAVAAIGGYGRRHLCLLSDLDLLVLFDGRIGDSEETFLRALLHPLWDAGVAVGHQVREMDDFHNLERDNPEFLLALLDARHVAGPRDLFERWQDMFHTAEAHAFILDSLYQLADERHAAFNGTLYQLEPDVKEAPGALRDVAATRTIAQLTDPSLLRKRTTEPARFDDAEDFLLRLRSALHAATSRNQNVLGHEWQEQIADLMGYPGIEPRQRVERLMSDYFRHARVVNRAFGWARRTAPRPVGPNLGLSRDGVGFLDPVLAARTPSSWLGAFVAAVAQSTSVSEEALSLIQQHVDRYRADDFFPEAAERTALLKFLKPAPGLYDRLSEMHDCGLLGRMFPEFQAISWRVVRDFYHKYTVDEHTLLTVRNLERLATTERPERLRFRNVLNELESSAWVVLALLFHDVGKWRDDDHEIESERMAEGVLARLHVSSEARETVLFLIRNHLKMSLVAFRRDTEDPDIVRDFAAFIGTESRLKMLCLMTLADVQAVSPDTLTPWKEELLWRLYVDTYNHLTQRYGDERIESDHGEVDGLISARPSDVSKHELSTFLQGLPRRYLQLFASDSIYRHARLARDLKADDVHVSLDQTDSGPWTLAVVTRDRPALFSSICGVLSSFGMNIIRGHAFTSLNGLVLDVFQFMDDEGFLAMNADGRERLSGVLEDAVAGRVDVAARLSGRERGILQPKGTAWFAPVVRADNATSSRYTILDIVATNAVGLLYRISRVIAAHHCDVDLVLIATEGEKAIDVFHLTTRGVKLTQAEQLALTADLQRTLEETR